MTLEQLRAFEAVVKHGSVRAASAHLHKSAPSISTAIKAIEDNLAIALFSRDSYRLVLTAEGSEFYDKTRVALRSVTELNDFSKQRWKKATKKYTLAVNTLVSQAHVVSLVERINHAFPHLQLNLLSGDFNDAANLVAEGHADLAISPLTGTISEEIEFKHLFSIQRIAVVSASSAIAQLTNPIKPAELLDETQLLLKGEEKNAQVAYRSIISGTRTFVVSDLKTKHSLIKSGVGWGWLPAHMALDDIAQGDLVRIDIDGYPIDSVEQFLVRPLDSHHSSTTIKLWTDSHLIWPKHA